MSCPVSDFFAADHMSTLQDWQKCSQTADATVCKNFVAAAQNTCQVDASSVSTCLNFMDFQTGYFLIAPMFCSSGG
jgi:hypothetical protein